MIVRIWLSLLLVLLLMIMLPVFFGEVMIGGLAKLHVSLSAAVTLVIAIFVGGFINIPVQRTVRQEEVFIHPLAVFGFSDLWPELRRVRRETVIAVNVGGCIIPTGLAAYELLHLVALGWAVLPAIGVACAVNCVVCYVMARPVPGVGIVMPGLVPPLISAALALLLAPEQAAPVAFVAGVTGPLIGADLLHLKDVRSSAFGVASIGGAGTFDGIVLSGIVAAYLA